MKRHWRLFLLAPLIPFLIAGCGTTTSTKGFNLSIPSATLNLEPGASGTVNVQIERLGGFTDAVALSIAGLDSDLTGTFEPANATGENSTLTLTAQTKATLGSRSITITGAGAGISKNVPLTLVIKSATGGTLTPPVITAFTATPSSLNAAGNVKLEWNVTGATSLEINQGVGVVTPLDAGSKTLSVNATKTFTLTAKNADGTVTATTDVTVGGPTTLGPGVWDQTNWNEALWQ
jgi:hypothetical protein